MSIVIGQSVSVRNNLFIQSGNALISRVSQWVGALPSSISVNATGVVANSITTSSSTTALLAIGDMIGYNLQGPFAMVTGVTSTTVTVSDPDGIWANGTFPVAIMKLPTSSTVEIFACIQMAELKMRTLELPALRSDPYAAIGPSVFTTDANGMVQIPADMNWPILFFQDNLTSNAPTATSMGPWIIYDRVGDREILRLRMIDQLYVKPFGVAKVIRASFSEVGPNYVFTPNPGVNTQIKAYYYKTFQQLFSSLNDPINPLTQINEVLASFPEGYFYATLWAYYDKNKNTEESQKWDARLQEAYGLIEDQNNKGKWSGGDRHLTSEFQPRIARYSTK